MASRSRGKEGDELDHDDIVMRLIKADNFDEGRIDEQAFSLTSSDKSSTPPSLSVYHRGITGFDDLFDLLSRTNASQIRIAELHVADILSIKLPERSSSALSVRWTPASNDPGAEIFKFPGADGHAGIVMNDVDPDKKGHRSKRAFIRSQLAEIASRSTKIIRNPK